MAASPPLKVYRGRTYVASCHFFEDAAALVALGEAGVVKFGHDLVLWREGREDCSAADSFDHAAVTMRDRLRHARREA